MREEFMMTRQGKQYVLFAGLLDEAHSRGLVGIDTELIQVPEETNGQVAVVKATVQIEESESGKGSGEPSSLRTFSGIGDASPQNVSRNIVPHLIRMAETRAKARALRDAVNVGATALEELSDGDDAPAQSHQNNQNPRSPKNAGAQKEASNQAPNLREAKGAETRGANTKGTGEGGAPDASDAGTSGQSPEKPGPRPVEDGGDQSSGQTRERGGTKAPKSQIDLIRTLAEEWRGEKGVERLESRIGKPLSELTRDEAEQWIDRLTPKEEADGR
ncbi:hypothetical protein [Rubrobacter aplysinae]|uniref:hypothetical protein n=1 Tax=Rubrobacter aplysinae TaxID=909625 RepID=UPI00069D2590|nr:hypothetical protein [Rubrobacter aplysinae]